MSLDGYRYSQVLALASSYLPGTRAHDAKIVDGMLITRDAQIEQLKNDVRDRERAIERYMEENAELRGYIGRARTILSDAFRAVQEIAVAKAAMPVLQAISRVLSLEIPGAGARLRRPKIHDAHVRVQLCASCDRKDLCTLIKPGSAPCGQNYLMLAEVRP